MSIELAEDRHSIDGARIRAKSSSGTTVIATDEHGIYELASPRPEDYTLTLLDPPPDHVAHDVKLTKQQIGRTGLFQLNMYAQWDGTIDGTVKDVDGRPAHVAIELRDPEGKQVSLDASHLPKRRARFISH